MRYIHQPMFFEGVVSFMSRLAILFSAACLALAVFCWPLAPAQAHAAYASSDPAANSTVKTAPAKVTITFLQNLDPKGLAIIVYDEKAKVVSTGAAQIDPQNARVASVTMKGDDSEIYRVDWNTVSAEDGDATLGAFVFGVGDTDKVTPPAQTKAASSGVNPWIAVLTGVIGLAVGIGATYAYARRAA